MTSDTRRNGKPLSGPGTIPVAPHSREAEEAVVACMLASETAAAEILGTGVRADDFFSEPLGLCFDAAATLARKDAPTNPITVADVLNARGQLDAIGGSAYLARLTTDLPTTVGAAYYALIVAKDASFRRLLSAGAAIGQRGYEGGTDFEAAIADAEAKLRAVRERAAAALARPRRIGEVVEADTDRLLTWMAEPGTLSGYPSGIAALDLVLGGFEPGRVYVVAARTSVGKSLAAVQLSTRLAARAPVLYLSLEMTAEQLKDRALFARAVVGRYAVRRRGVLYQSEVSALADAADWLGPMDLWIEDAVGYQWPALRAAIAASVVRDGVRIVVLDHLDLVAAGNSRENRHAQLAEVMADLKGLAMRHRIAVLALSQIRRTQNDPPTLDDLRESGSKEESADAVLVLDRPASRKTDTGKDPSLVHRLDVAVLKNRDGATGHFPLWVDLDTQRLHDWNDGKGPHAPQEENA